MRSNSPAGSILKGKFSEVGCWTLSTILKSQALSQVAARHSNRVQAFKSHGQEDTFRRGCSPERLLLRVRTLLPKEEAVAPHVSNRRRALRHSHRVTWNL